MLQLLACSTCRLPSLTVSPDEVLCSLGKHWLPAAVLQRKTNANIQSDRMRRCLHTESNLHRQGYRMVGLFPCRRRKWSDRNRKKTLWKGDWISIWRKHKESRQIVGKKRGLLKNRTCNDSLGDTSAEKGRWLGGNKMSGNTEEEIWRPAVSSPIFRHMLFKAL